MEVKEGKTILKVPHGRGKLTFQYPAFKGTFEQVAEQIDNAKLRRPTSSETASLVYDSWQNPERDYESKIIKILKDAWLWEFTGNLYLPKGKGDYQNGVILETNPEIKNGKYNSRRINNNQNFLFLYT